MCRLYSLTTTGSHMDQNVDTSQITLEDQIYLKSQKNQNNITSQNNVNNRNEWKDWNYTPNQIIQITITTQNNWTIWNDLKITMTTMSTISVDNLRVRYLNSESQTGSYYRLLLVTILKLSANRKHSSVTNSLNIRSGQNLKVKCHSITDITTLMANPNNPIAPGDQDEVGKYSCH